MNFASTLQRNDFEALCREAFKVHAKGMCNPFRFTSPFPPHHSDFDPSDFQFVERAGRRCAIWVCGFDSTPSCDRAYICVYTSVWLCRYLTTDEMPLFSEPCTLAQSISDDFCAILQDFDPRGEYGYFDPPTRKQIAFTVITNSPIHPSEGTPTLYDALSTAIEKRVHNVDMQIGTGATIPFQSEERCVYAVDITPEIVHWLREDPRRTCSLSPEQFELLIGDRLSKMGFGVLRTGPANRRDGGNDMLAWPIKAAFPFLLALQAKHHRLPTTTTGVSTVRDLRGVLGALPVDVGVLVTNTSFTPDARWAADQGPRILRLRDICDLARWLADDYTRCEGLRELPRSIQLAPGLTFDIPTSSASESYQDSNT